MQNQTSASANTSSNANANANTAQLNQIDLQAAVEDMMLVLNSKEKEVLIRRFSLNNDPKETLDSIWKRFSITRERVRQIEWNALNKLRRTAHSSQLRFINKEAENILADSGWVMREEDLVASILNKLWKDNLFLEWNMIRLSLSVDTEIEKNNKSKTLLPSWRFMEIKLSDIETITNAAFNLLKKKGDVSWDEWVVSSILELSLFKNKRPTDKLIISSLNTDSRIHRNWEWWGLMEWRSVNPKSIKDKAKIVLQKEKLPLHFVDIANSIAEVWFKKRSVTIQAVHNELIKYDDFVLVWRWIYWLKEWWMISWSVSDVIENVLEDNKDPMVKYKIVREVQKLRDVKVWTISLNLQKNPRFIRVGRAMYTLKRFEDKKD